MHKTVPFRVPNARAPRDRRIAVAVLGTLTAAVVITGCSTTSTTTGQPSSTASTVVTAPSSSAPSPSGNGPGTSQPGGDDGNPPPVSPGSPESPAPQPTTSAPAQPGSSSHPPSGTPFGGEGLSAQQITDLQKAVDGGHQPWRLDRIQVAKTFVLGQFGWSDVQTSGDAPNIVFVTNSDGSKVGLNLSQPATQGSQGIWVVQSGMWSRAG
ncbi:hypothetical protein [Nocardia sp. NBC_01327]|uniref:hypothetical protein n=1 Tax=Nocardia sp. NBC_01327 TaxID=2903593 RepID=UPI002E160ED3|nr:hypothetical protein OG326_20815 [Nocardia sp. NBC_01327]